MDTVASRPHRLAATPTSRTMSIAARVYGYPPAHNAGSEWMLHSMLRPLAERGHRVTVWLSHPGTIETSYDIDGVRVIPTRRAPTSPPTPSARTCCCPTSRTSRSSPVSPPPAGSP
ncbi:hypothetical protein [Streptomyces sp. CA-132043]|uniref:hypothetical protein n=1 Tax=Streptomyces sp. CA-132043 TaxID=3240048 RepID=UPI003D8A2F81